MSQYNYREKFRQIITLGAAVQTLNPIEFKLDNNCRAIIIGLERVVTTVPANDPLVTPLLSIEMRVNSNVIIPNMTQAEFRNVIENLDKFQPSTISNGMIFQKMFMPPLKKESQIAINLVINTLALGTTTPAATAQFTLKVYAVDAKLNEVPSNECMYIKRLPVVNCPTLNTDFPIQIGTDARKIVDYIFTELTVAALSDTWLGEIEFNLDSVRLMRIGTALMKEMYRSLSNNAVPAGYYLFKLPYPINASAFQSVVANVNPHTTLATANITGFERYIKSY